MAANPAPLIVRLSVDLRWFNLALPVLRLLLRAGVIPVPTATRLAVKLVRPKVVPA